MRGSAGDMATSAAGATWKMLAYGGDDDNSMRNLNN